MTTAIELDKAVEPLVTDGYGTIAIRVVVLQKGLASAPALSEGDSAPVDAAPDEHLPETDKRPVSTFLEKPKHGQHVCVFLINGQRQHAWDNLFIVRDLAFKYLRNRMLIVVDCDGLKPEAIADLMQGSRNQFYEGKVYAALESRVIAVLKRDPDLSRLQEEAEDDLARLEAGDEAVKSALDQLIESHHEAASHTHHGHTQSGDATREDGTSGSLIQSQDVVVEDDRFVGTDGSEPVLQIRPDIATIRLKPNEKRRLFITPKPESAWKTLESLALSFDPPVKELQVSRTSGLTGEDVSLVFAEAEDFDDDEYPIETFMRASATFKGQPEVRMLERRVVVTPKRVIGVPPKPSIPLKDDPTFVRVTSRQPIKIVIGGADVHVRLRWDGKDELLEGNPSDWTLRASCEAPTVEPSFFLTKPVDGRFELLIQASNGLKPGEQLKFDVEAVGQGKTISTAFLADVAESESARKIAAKSSGGKQRRPPYSLVYIKRENWNDGNFNCFGEPWSGADAGSFELADAKTPLTIFINSDMDLLASYRDMLLAKKQAETTIQQRINKYTAHLAFHLYQMSQKKKQAETQAGSAAEYPSDDLLRDESQRVSHTLIKLMEVSY